MNINRLLFYNNIRNDEIVKMAAKIDDTLTTAAADTGLPGEIEDDYYELQRRLLDCMPVGDTYATYWQNYICRLTAEAENTFSILAEKSMADETTVTLAKGDVADIARLFAIDWKKIAERIDKSRPCVCSMMPPVEEDGRAILIKEALEEKDEEKAAQMILDYYEKHSSGILGKFKAFIWDGKLEGVKNHDPITFDDLVGYEVQQEQLIRNTEVFVKGRKANNVLLYGDKGTGKSSSVKALLNKFGDEGLRIINLSKERIFDVNKIMETVSGRGCKFIIFIDDLSFESTEIEYKHFKSILEGGVEVQPDNVLVYVTSNRRNLVKETWKDRTGDEGEIHVNDGIQERQSLADRFGLTITFSAPDKKLYTEIVKSIADREGLDIEEEQLIEAANKWDMRQTSRSGRSAKQFVTHIAGQQD